MTLAAPDRVGELAWQRHLRPLSEEDCQIWLGVSLATIERVEAGEIAPGPELAARIGRFLKACGGGFIPFFPRRSSAARSPADSVGGGEARSPHLPADRAGAAAGVSLHGGSPGGGPVQSSRRPL